MKRKRAELEACLITLHMARRSRQRPIQRTFFLVLSVGGHDTTTR